MSNSVSNRVGFVSLGCPKALVDSERILTELRNNGYEIVGNYDEAGLVIVNTCGFIDAAKEESLDAISEALDENGQVIVTGCMGKDAENLNARFPKLLAVTGPQQYNDVVRAVRQSMPVKQSDVPAFTELVPQGVKLTPPHYAYLKISEGCNHSCTFCIIPSMRGKLVSRPADEILQEAERLVASGVQELLVISQDTSAYGVDLKYKPGFWNGQPVRSHITDLAQALGSFGVWVRLHYVYPYPHVDDLIPMMRDGLILPYLDIPFQHANQRILKAMKRPAASAKTLDRIKAWRQECPDLTLRSTFIVGFPGETDAEFDELLDFLTEAQLDRVGAFAYSPVDGAVANTLSDHVPEQLQQERLQRLMMHQAAISTERLKAKIGKETEVIIDTVHSHHCVARSQADSPEIDGHVHLDHLGVELRPGDRVLCEITGSDEHDLRATLLLEQ